MPITDKEKRRMEKLVNKQKYVDKDFPLSPDEKNLKWKRPHEIVNKPELFVDGPSHMDIRQHNLGDCWFLAAASVIAQHPHLINQVLPADQYLYGKYYTGILAFRFWNLGQWTTVYIDDTLAVDEDDELHYGQCTTSNEFWLPLLEKAFAKYHGGYKNIEGGLSTEAMLILTGYVTEDIVEPKLNEVQLYNMFSTAVQHNALITVGSPTSSYEEGIVGYHVYSVTGVYSVEVGDSTVRLLRIRNPWGDIQDTIEWKGAFSDDDPKWTGVDTETRKKLEYVKDEDGQFFMKVSHFKRHFTHFWMAYKSPNFGVTTFQQIYNFSNVWDKGIVVKGEGVEYADNFLRNPLYTLTVEEKAEEEESEYEIDLDEETVDESDDEDATPPSYNVIIQLIQDQNRGKYRTEIYPIGISVFQTGGRYPNELGPENLEEFEPHKGSVEPVVHGSIVARLNLRPGKYIVVPWVMIARMSRPFLMRVYALQRVTMEAVKREE
ncbi:hypothetical protein R5R35_013165 [Gryllus longicercus]|uniref:Calpain catalytic domain-containing protein n=1 Tax=Gryllus longicercus TaxID=2509291 RepID=A0AAN9V2P9_9ORTH